MIEAGPGALKVAVIGSRGYPDLDAVRRFVAHQPPGTVIVTGCARGVDEAARRAAAACGLSVEVFRAEWDTHGKAAGPLRNTRLVAAADRVVAFWDGHSRGTLDAVRKAKKLGKLCQVKQPGQAWRAVS